MSENAKIQHPCELFLSNCHKPDGVLDKVEIHISKSCNIACPWCYGKFLASKERNMPMMTFRKLIDSLDKINPLITIAGLYTDPLTHPDINGFVHYIGCYGYRFALYTNGFLLNDDLNRELERAASCNRTDRPSYISINACKYEEDEDFARIRALCARKKDLLVTANLIPNYVRNLRHTIKELHAAGVDVIRLSMPWAIEDKLDVLKDKGYLIMASNAKDEFPYISLRHLDAPKPFDRCSIADLSCCVRSDGGVYPCPETCTDKFSHLCYGNVNDTPLPKIWTGRKRKGVVSKLDKDRKCVCCPINNEYNAKYNHDGI